jgi:hypothetical protein
MEQQPETTIRVYKDDLKDLNHIKIDLGLTAPELIHYWIKEHQNKTNN